MIKVERPDEQRVLKLHDRLLTIATTGTNGKTTTTTMIASIVKASGQPWAMATTLGGQVNGQTIQALEASGAPARVTSLATFLATVDQAVEAKVQTLAMEVTSLALMRGAALKWPAHIGVFTNITRDHLDVHESPEAYLAAKAQLFIHLKAQGAAVLNADDPASALLEEIMPKDARVLTFSLEDPKATLAAKRVEATLGRTRVELWPGSLADAMGGALELKMTGRVHAANALAAALAAHLAGYEPQVIKRGLEACEGVPGRFELVRAEGAHSPGVVVDYAHTPEGLRGTLETARALLEQRLSEAAQPGKLCCVFGCGGERDQGKRPLMAQCADELADVVILTSDNPRREDPKAIAQQVLSGVPNPMARWRIALDRAAAIRVAIKDASEHDLIIIAGKGHEQSQEIGNKRIAFSDVEVAKAALTNRP